MRSCLHYYGSFEEKPAFYVPLDSSPVAVPVTLVPFKSRSAMCLISAPVASTAKVRPDHPRSATVSFDLCTRPYCLLALLPRLLTLTASKGFTLSML